MSGCCGPNAKLSPTIQNIDQRCQEDTFVDQIEIVNNQVCVTRNDGVTLCADLPPATVDTDTFINGLTIVGGQVCAQRSDGSEFCIDLPDDSDEFITNAVIDGSTITITRSDGQTWDIELPAATDVFINDATINGNTITITRSDGQTWDIDLPVGPSICAALAALTTGAQPAYCDPLVYVDPTDCGVKEITPELLADTMYLDDAFPNRGARGVLIDSIQTTGPFTQIDSTVDLATIPGINIPECHNMAIVFARSNVSVQSTESTWNATSSVRAGETNLTKADSISGPIFPAELRHDYVNDSNIYEVPMDGTLLTYLLSSGLVSGDPTVGDGRVDTFTALYLLGTKRSNRVGA